MKKKAVFITNIPSPYRVDFFSYMQKNFPEYEVKDDHYQKKI